MYELVENSRQQRNFEKTWEYFCTKYGWENDPYAEDGSRYNLLLPKERFYKRGKVIGTIEFIPYNPHNPNSTVEGPGRSSFLKYEEIKVNQHRIWEIDKLCIHQDYQRRGYLHVLFQTIVNHASENKTIYYLALIEQRLFRMLRILFGNIVGQKGDALVGPTTALIPTIINANLLLEDDEALRKIFKKRKSK